MKRKGAYNNVRSKKQKTTYTGLGKRKRGSDGKPLLRPKGPGDWSLPGYNYIGPGNPVDDYEPVDEDDRLAMEHDNAYTRIQQEGEDPYYKYSEDDEYARQHFGHGWGGWLGKGFFTGKKIAAKIRAIGYVIL